MAMVTPQHAQVLAAAIVVDRLHSIDVLAVSEYLDSQGYDTDDFSIELVVGELESATVDLRFGRDE